MLNKYILQSLFLESENLDKASEGDFSISYLGRKITYPNTQYTILEAGSMQDSYVYEVINKNDYVIKLFTDYLASSILLTRENIEEQYLMLKRMASSPLNKSVVEAFDNGDIELAYSKDVHGPVIFPYMIRKHNGKIVATILVDAFGTLNADASNLTIPIKNLYALMESAYIALRLTTDGMKVARNSNLMRLCASIYTEMIIRCINKDFSIVSIKDTYAQTLMAIAYFFLVNVWGISPEMASSYAFNIVQEKMGQMYNAGLAGLDEVVMQLQSQQVTRFPDLIAYITTLSPRLS